MPAPPLAHLGHWYVSLPVFMGPVLLLVITLKVRAWREQHHRPDQSGKRRTVIATHDDRGNTTITVTGRLDYPALLAIETELGKTVPGSEILLDLRLIAEADRDTAWSLCDTIGKAPTRDRVIALVRSEPAMHALRTICTEEGIQLLDQRTPEV